MMSYVVLMIYGIYVILIFNAICVRDKVNILCEDAFLIFMKTAKIMSTGGKDV